MPEYLAPGVYVEEVPSGSKPIEGASTSTAAMVGVTQRGPEATPTLVTSFAAFVRTFGGYLPPAAFTGGNDALPYAADGFFANGGTRLFVTRIVGDGATSSSATLVQRSEGDSGGSRIGTAAAVGATELAIGGGSIAADDLLVISDDERTETVTVTAAGDPAMVLAAPTANAHPAGNAVTRLDATAPTGAFNGALAAGATQISISDADGIVNDTLLLVRDAGADRSRDEVVTVTAVAPGAGAADPDVLTVTALVNTHPAGSSLLILSNSASTFNLAAELPAASTSVPLGGATGFAAGSIVRLGGGGTAELVRIERVEQTVTVDPALAFAHAANVAVTPGTSGLVVHASSRGSWGNDLRITTREAAQVATQLNADAATDATSITLRSAFGLFPGSVVVVGPVLDDDGNVTTPSATAVVDAVNTVSGEVTLRDALGTAYASGARVVSQEFSLTVERMEKGKAAESETFERLSLAAGHPRNVGQIIGRWDEDTGEPSLSGGSNLIRISVPEDAAGNPAAFDHRIKALLRGGTDDIANVTDQTYIGTPSVDPADRTGIQALENEPTVSLVAVPGRTSVAVQNALVEHCERMRYRFAVLDTPLGARLNEAREHRQNFDTTRAAVYYPGLTIPNRFAAPGELINITSSGHVMGVMARTDATRGVHKAPANEVVRGIPQFETKLGKGEQDILNPLHINCHRDFREQNRGLRVYGARVATSDPEYKYINVRRLLIFIEQSLDTGLQWAVFEPNSEPLWATVKQSVSNFLTTVWRSGALAGLTQEEAFFVNIGYDVTMTQDDLDNGRMIVEIGVAPVKPAEFVIARISQKTREASS